ncbi:MAG: iron-sulfur cluster assembly protein [Bacteroidales bacterium]|nr:iron-sulfur cluster assembly protein [Bacteroidales bacterium]
MNTKDELSIKIVDVLKKIYDPEIPVNIYDLGLIYDILIDDEYNVEIKMTLTSPNCPMVDSMLQEIYDKTRTIDGVKSVVLNIVFDPPWDKSMMSDEAKLDLGLI